MGNSSSFSPNYPEAIPLSVSAPVYVVSASQVYNFLQEQIFYPHRYIFYDIRSSKAHYRISLQSAVWAWAANGEPVGFFNGKANTAKNAFLASLKKNSSGKTVVICGDPDIRSVHPFLECLRRSEANTRLVCVLKGGLRTIINSKRYKPCLSNYANPYQGPIEAKCVCVTGIDVFFDQKDVLDYFKFNSIINISRQAVPRSFGVTLDIYSSKFGAPDLIDVAKCINDRVKSKRRILIIDDFRGRENAPAACVAFLVLQKVDVSIAIQYVKERKPSADMNYLRMIHALVTSLESIKIKNNFCKNFKERPKKSVRIPLNQLDKWDDVDDDEHQSPATVSSRKPVIFQMPETTPPPPKTMHPPIETTKSVPSRMSTPTSISSRNIVPALARSTIIQQKNGSEKDTPDNMGHNRIPRIVGPSQSDVNVLSDSGEQVYEFIEDEDEVENPDYGVLYEGDDGTKYYYEQEQDSDSLKSGSFRQGEVIRQLSRQTHSGIHNIGGQSPDDFTDIYNN